MRLFATDRLSSIMCVWLDHGQDTHRDGPSCLCFTSFGHSSNLSFTDCVISLIAADREIYFCTKHFFWHNLFLEKKTLLSVCTLLSSNICPPPTRFRARLSYLWVISLDPSHVVVGHLEQFEPVWCKQKHSCCTEAISSMLVKAFLLYWVQLQNFFCHK